MEILQSDCGFFKGFVLVKIWTRRTPRFPRPFKNGVAWAGPERLRHGIFTLQDTYFFKRMCLPISCFGDKVGFYKFRFNIAVAQPLAVILAKFFFG
jgi:hypothetical protein